MLFAGDTLFAGSVGRTDLPGGDMATLMASLKKLTALPDDTVVIPGHGMFTTIGDENRGNPFLQESPRVGQAVIRGRSRPRAGRRQGRSAAAGPSD